MIGKYEFELALEKVAEKFYFFGASQHGKKRGGNSADNEVYFRTVASNLRDELQCQQIMIQKGACPDSGVFGEFNYKAYGDVNWDLVKEKKTIVLEVDGVERQKRYLEFDESVFKDKKSLGFKKTGLKLNLNDLDTFGEFFGVEYKASGNCSEGSINVASFNSTCPSATKITTLKNVKVIHNFPRQKQLNKNDIKLSESNIDLNIAFSMYYLIVNDCHQNNTLQIRKVFICDGGFFAPGLKVEEAQRLSKQLYPEDLNIKVQLNKVGLRYRPFFDSRTIKASGDGLYTSWEPKLPALEKVERKRKQLLDEIEKIQQDDGFEGKIEEQLSLDLENEKFENVIYLSLRDRRIKDRVA